MIKKNPSDFICCQYQKRWLCCVIEQNLITQRYPVALSKNSFVRRQEILSIRIPPVLQAPHTAWLFFSVYEFVFLCEQWALQCLLLPCSLSIRCLTERWAAAALSLDASISLSPFRSHRPRNGGSIRHDPRTHTVLHYPVSQTTAFRSLSGPIYVHKPIFACVKARRNQGQ